MALVDFTDPDVRECLGLAEGLPDKVLGQYRRAAKRVEARIAKALCLDQCEPKEYTLSLDLPHAKRAAFSFGIGAVTEVLEVTNGGCVLDPGDYYKRRGRLWLCCGEWSACGCPSVVVKVIAGLDATDETLMQIIIDAVGAEACALDPRIKSERSSLRNYTLFAPAELGYPPGFTEDLWHCVQDMRVTQNPGLRLQPHC